MAPKREAPPLPGNDKFDGDYSDEKRRQLVRSDGARKCGSLKYKLGEPVQAAWHRRDVPEFDRLRREREIRRRQQLRLHGEGSSSAAPSAPPPEGYNPEHFGVTLGPEDFVSDEQMEQMMAAALLQSSYEAKEEAATAKLNSQVNEGLLQQALVISTLPPTIDLVTDSEEE